MKISDFGRYALAICPAVAMLSGCGNNGGAQLAPAGAMEQNAVQSGLKVRLTGALQSVATSSKSLRATVGPNLYVANYDGNSVTVYAQGSGSVLRTISHGVYHPLALAFDGTLNLYVVNVPASSGYYGDVTVYARGSKKVLRTISQGVNGPDALAFDGSGNLYVASSGGNTVTVYAPGSKKVLRTISEGVGFPDALAFDGSGNLYVANANNDTVTVYAPGRESRRKASLVGNACGGGRTPSGFSSRVAAK
jgi:hypothetical protein